MADEFYHVRDYGEIDRSKPVAELVVQGADIFAWIQKHHASGPGAENYPTHGRFVGRADCEIWRPFSLRSVLELPVIGEAARETFSDMTRSSDFWHPGVVAVKIDGEEGLGAGRAHIMEVDEDLERTVPATIVREIGVGQVFGDRTLRAAAGVGSFVVLRAATVNGQDRLAVRTYYRPDLHTPDTLIIQREIPDDEVCLDFLQMARNATYDCNYEPA